MHMCLDQIYPLPSPCKLLPLHLHVLSLPLIRAEFSSCWLHRVGPSAGTRATSQGSSDESGTSWTPSPIHTEIVTSLVVCTQSQLRRGHVCDGCVPLWRLATVIYSLSLTSFLTPLLRWLLNFGWRSVTETFHLELSILQSLSLWVLLFCESLCCYLLKK